MYTRWKCFILILIQIRESTSWLDSLINFIGGTLHYLPRKDVNFKKLERKDGYIAWGMIYKNNKFVSSHSDVIISALW